MKALKIIIITVFIAVVLAGCGRNNHIVRHKARRFQCIEQWEDCYVLVDTETGIGYLKTGYDGGLSVMHDFDGNIYRPNGWRDYGE